ncbi:hypothetical protein CHU98_g7961 [Xylaria longipes]|nr:hypothetical protein CHU98_g7961 [Xylaria longipes]
MESSIPPYVVVILEELGVPYGIIPIKFDDVKRKRFIDINPKGRCPKSHHLSQWLQFQMSAQGPYYGVAACFRALDDRTALMEGAGLENATGRPARFESHQEYEAAIARGKNTDPQVELSTAIHVHCLIKVDMLPVLYTLAPLEVFDFGAFFHLR